MSIVVLLRYVDHPYLVLGRYELHSFSSIKSCLNCRDMVRRLLRVTILQLSNPVGSPNVNN